MTTAVAPAEQNSPCRFCTAQLALHTSPTSSRCASSVCRADGQAFLIGQKRDPGDCLRSPRCERHPHQRPVQHRPATPPGHRRWHKDNLSPEWAVVMCCDSPVEEKCAGNFPGWSASLPAEGVCSGAIVRQPRPQTAWSGDPSVDAVTYLPRRLSRCDQDWLAPAVRGWRKQ